jgi:hypothetical protein
MIRLYLWFCRVLFCCTRTMGAVGTRPSLRPPFTRGRFALITRTLPCRENEELRLSLRCHAPRMRGIQYAAASRLKHKRLWNTGSPDKPVDDDGASAVEN